MWAKGWLLPCNHYGVSTLCYDLSKQVSLLLSSFYANTLEAFKTFRLRTFK